MPRVYKRRIRSGGGRARALAIRKSRRYAAQRYRRTRIRGGNVTFLGRPPRNGLVKMRYCDTLSINPGTAPTASRYYFRANSIFDPDATGVGHQPLSHDQWSLFFNHYRVYGSKITIKFSADAAAAPLVVGLFLNDDQATASTNFNDIIEQGRGRWKVVDSSGGPGNKTLTYKYSAKRFHNCTNVKDRNDLKASFGSNPSEEAFFTVWVASQELATDPGPLAVTVMIDYIVGLEEPKELAQS